MSKIYICIIYPNILFFSENLAFSLECFVVAIQLLLHLKIENFQKLLENLKKENDYVIIDTPPFLQNADTEEMAQMADASLLVVAEHRAQAKDLNAALDLLNAQGEKNLGCVYNNAHVEFLRPMACLFLLLLSLSGPPLPDF